MTSESEFDDDDDSQVVASFSIFAVTPIKGLEEYLDGHTVSSEGYRYSLGTTTFDEPSWEFRASRLKTTIEGFIDRLASIPREALHAPGGFVRLFLTLPAGSETIDAETVKRLADVNATIWIDA